MAKKESKKSPIKKEVKTKSVLKKRPDKKVDDGDTIKESSKPQTEKSNSKYIKICADEPQEKFSELGRKVISNELKWCYYAMENDKGYHFYIKI
jgi:hypothetical protein